MRKAFGFSAFFGAFILLSLSSVWMRLEHYQSIGDFSNVHCLPEQTSPQVSFLNFPIYPKRSFVVEKQQQKELNRGIVMCLHEKIASLGISLILELRCLGDFTPIEIAYCTEQEMSPETKNRILEADPLVTLVDVCESFSAENNTKMIKEFQSYFVKPLSLIKSKFDEVMLVDSDAIFIQAPNALWDVQGYKRTGTLFFRDRPWVKSKFLSLKMQDPESSDEQEKIPFLQYLFKIFDPKPFLQYSNGKNVSSIRNNVTVTAIQPSEELRQSLSWKGESGHYQESSVVLFNKLKQPRATKILEYLIFEGRFTLPRFSWGDKEFFFLSCALAESEYFFSPWGASVTDGFRDLEDHPDTLCGALTHFFPSDDVGEKSLMHINANLLLQPHHKMGARVQGAMFKRFNDVPSRVTVRIEKEVNFGESKRGGQCLNKIQSMSLPQAAIDAITRRRAHYSALKLNSTFALGIC